MLKVIEQTRDEKIAMYMKMTKRELVAMLINANDAIDMLQKDRGRTPEPSPWVGPNTSVIINKCKGLKK